MGSSVKNTVQVSFEPMAESYGEPRGAFALATTMFALTIAVASPIVGVLSDTLGPLVVLRSGLVVSAGMFVSLSFAQNFVLLAVLYGTLGAIGYASLSYIPIGVLADRAFPPERRGFFYALLTNGTALGFILLVPLWIWLESVTTWQSVMLALGGVFVVVFLPLSFTVRVVEPASRSVADSQHSRVRGMTAALSVPFAPLALAFMACGATMAFINVHLMPDMADHGVTSTAMSSAMIFIGSTEIIGAFIAGLLCDRGFVRGILLAAYLLRGSAVLLLAVGPNDVVVHFFGVVFGSSYLMTVVATTVWIVESYPARVRGLLLGVLWAVHQVGAALSSQVGAVLHDHVGGYELRAHSVHGKRLVRDIARHRCLSPESEEAREKRGTLGPIGARHHRLIGVNRRALRRESAKRAYRRQYGDDRIRSVFAQALGSLRSRLLARFPLLERPARFVVYPNVGRGVSASLYEDVFGGLAKVNCWEYGRSIGHTGVSDQILALSDLVDRKVLSVGDRVLLIGAGNGLSVSVMLVEVRSRSSGAFSSWIAPGVPRTGSAGREPFSAALDGPSAELTLGARGPFGSRLLSYDIRERHGHGEDTRTIRTMDSRGRRGSAGAARQSRHRSAHTGDADAHNTRAGRLDYAGRDDLRDQPRLRGELVGDGICERSQVNRDQTGGSGFDDGRADSELREVGQPHQRSDVADLRGGRGG